MENKAEILIIGAGASGLMAAYELARAGKKVIVVEARDRIGGRISPLDEKRFGYPAQAGAEFVHGEAVYTKALIKEAGLTYIVDDNELWSARGGEFSKMNVFLPYLDDVKEYLKKVEKDIPITEFIRQYLQDEKYAELRNAIIKLVQGYDAADPEQISTFMLRDEWLSIGEFSDGRIDGGYKPLVDHLVKKCVDAGVEFHLNKKIDRIEWKTGSVVAYSGEYVYTAKKVIVTVALPVIKDITFAPPLLEKTAFLDRIGFGQVIKVIFKFDDIWWEKLPQYDMTKLSFFFCNDPFTTWWVQYPYKLPVLTGWIAGPEAKQYSTSSDEELIHMGLGTLERLFNIQNLKEKLQDFHVANWVKDPLTKGAYSYTTYKTGNAYTELAKPVEDTVYFAGEALAVTANTATVEGAFASGKEVAEKILK